MKTVDLTHCPTLPTRDEEPCVMALGFFDGVHIGHQQVIAAAKQIADRRNLKLAVMTFYPHPKEVLSHGKIKMAYLTPMGEKKKIFAKLGVDKLYVIHFDLNFAKLSPEEFIGQYVIGLNAKHIIAGFDFTYGYKGQGNMETIEDDGKGYFQVTKIPKIDLEGQKISSTFIRELLSHGDVRGIASCLGDFYETKGDIFKYTKDSRGIRAEISTHPFYTLPTVGVYEIEVHIGKYIYHGISHIRAKTEDTIVNEITLSYLRKNIRHQTVKIKWLDRLFESKSIELNVKH
ncbi:cytidyltransferase [Fictibacillus enclensis]|nr:cytidyltransferase [Fictibacillus enclensis]MDM5196754.1 cytidyltransferase [Fictibacillus enclensis]